MYNNNFYPYYNYGYTRPNMLSRLSSFAGKAKVNWSNILNNTQKTLNIINQAIPVIYQIKPIYNNAKTIFRVMGAVKGNNVKINTTDNIRTNSNSNSNINTSNNNTNNTSRAKTNDSPTFFL